MKRTIQEDIAHEFTLLDQAKTDVAETLDALREQELSMRASRVFGSAAEQGGYDERLREIAEKQADAEARWAELLKFGKGEFCCLVSEYRDDPRTMWLTGDHSPAVYGVNYTFGAPPQLSI